jgi:hypothetical protein
MLLFLPSLFAWSITALKEPLYLFLTACAVSWSVTIVRQRRWAMKLLAAAGVVVVVAALQTIRDQGGVLTGAGILAGFFLGWIVSRPGCSLRFRLPSRS